MVNEQDYVVLGLSCAQVCSTLDLGAKGKKLVELSRSVCDAMDQLAT